MANVRRFFRYDVEIPILLQTQEQFERQLEQLQKEIVSSKDEMRIKTIDAEVEQILKQMENQGSQSLTLFHTFNQRLNFMHWLLEHYLQLTDPREATDFNYRLRMDKHHNPPQMNQSNKLLILMQNFYAQIDELIHELIQVAQTSIDGRLFIFSPTPRRHFKAEDFIKNLNLVAKKGILPAQLMLLIIEKYNLLVDVFNRLKEKFYKISSIKNWPKLEVNLSAGGCSFKTNERYEKFTRFNIFMQLNDKIIAPKGRIVMVRRIKDPNFQYQVGIEFEFIPVDAQKTITYFIQLHELRDAYNAYPKVQISQNTFAHP